MKYTVTFIASLLFALNTAHGMDQKFPDDCQADFTYSYDLRIMCFAPCAAIQFTDISAGEPIHWFWDFGDGYTSREKNPLHVYTLLSDSIFPEVPGEIKVCLKVVFADSCISEQCKAVSLNGMPGECQVFFRPYRNDTVISIPEIIPYSFYTHAPENTVQWQWDFGDGKVSSDPNPVHGYSFMGGVYTVCLTILTADSCSATYCTDLQTGSPDTIIIPDCHAGFTFKMLESYPVQYAFYDSSYGEPFEWYWDFGDGSFSMEPNPVHVFENVPWNDSIGPDGTYRSDFTYQVCLTITTPTGCTSTFCQSINAPPHDTIVPAPCDYRIRLNTSNVLGMPCSGTASASLISPFDQKEVPASVYWSTGMSGNFVSGLCANMPYYVILTTASGCTVAGSFAIMDYSVPVFPYGTWSFTAAGDEYRFRYSPPDSTYQCYWDFGDGEEVQGDDVTHTMDPDENNSVTLTVYDENGNLVHSEEIKLSNATGSVDVQAGPALRLYPNPASERLYLELRDEGYEFIDIIVVDVTGKQVLDRKLPRNPQGTYSVDVADLPQGFYVLRIMYNNQPLGSGRFIK